ncbi:hypothetical protein [Nitrosomonas communis]|jgi:hypothetical protein|uniref:Uncharacterized protein n=1 Tax=Nitrosomonas communis TaxID=44574 RepID=A0A1I4SZ08_9PROT|nr:hypothetical protein [Nitrosomonas communis]SFM69619.1 hypothetical protein SAMN05421863_10456 [Nitrosomonas communis]
MKTISHLLLVTIFSFASVAQADSAPYCWLLDTAMPGHGNTQLQLFDFNDEANHRKNNKNRLVSGTASFDIITTPPFQHHTRLVNGSSTTVNDKIEISLHASEAENVPDSGQKSLWSGTYHLILDANSLNGIFLLRASEDDPQRTLNGEATLTKCE